MQVASLLAPRSAPSRLRLLGCAAVAAATLLAAGCTPKIGDDCFSSTDCSVRGDRLCDTTQPGGYCTVFNCRPNRCPDEASCVLFEPALPGCGFDDRAGGGGSRVARSSCMRRCEVDADCRSGYVCADPKGPPWNAFVLDDDQSARSCLLLPSAPLDAGASAAPPPVCSATGPVVPPIDASAPAPPADAGAPAPDAGDGDAG